jgi:uncharacterized protein
MENRARTMSRRRFVGLTGGAAATLALLGPSRAFASASEGPFGELVPDPGGLLDLPHGFQYRVLSTEGSPTMRNGAVEGIPVPGSHDGMAAFAGPGNTTVLVRNHEQAGSAGPPVVGTNPYTAEPGGTMAIVVGPNREELDAFVTSAGTQTNCAGGATPWGTWVTCEETRSTDHGYCFEVMWDDPENALSRTPITAMGFFSHESIDVDPRTGVVYLTEDDFRGSIPADPNTEVDTNPAFRSSFLYRYLPNDRSQRPGALQQGGTLQALVIDGASRNADLYNPGQQFVVRWVTVNPAEPHDDALGKGAVRFTQLEGSNFAGGAFWFDDTQGGEARRGQIYRLIGMTPEGQTYTFARNRLPGEAEFAGPTFAPDGQTFFVNVQDPGTTLAIWGPFARQNRERQRVMARAAPANEYSPKISGELAEAAQRYGLSHLEAAAYERLGVPLV